MQGRCFLPAPHSELFRKPGIAIGDLSFIVVKESPARNRSATPLDQRQVHTK
jgi:hypothetical protein